MDKRALMKQNSSACCPDSIGLSRRLEQEPVFTIYKEPVDFLPKSQHPFIFWPSAAPENSGSRAIIFLTPQDFFGSEDEFHQLYQPQFHDVQVIST